MHVCELICALASAASLSRPYERGANSSCDLCVHVRATPASSASYACQFELKECIRIQARKYLYCITRLSRDQNGASSDQDCIMGNAPYFPKPALALLNDLKDAPTCSDGARSKSHVTCPCAHCQTKPWTKTVNKAHTTTILERPIIRPDANFHNQPDSEPEISGKRILEGKERNGAKQGLEGSQSCPQCSCPTSEGISVTNSKSMFIFAVSLVVLYHFAFLSF